MSVSDFLKELLEEEKITQTEKNIRKIRKEIKDFLVAHYRRNGKDVDYIYSGSLAKGTAIKSKYDIDIGIIFNNKDFETLEEMFFDVKEVLEEKYGNVNVREQNVSIRVNYNGYEIDVVPCRKINEDDSMDVYLYINRDDNNRIKSNLERHVEIVRDFKDRDVIKLLKIWRYRKKFKFKSFALELLAIRALGNEELQGLDKKFKCVLEFIKNNIDEIRLEDPANTNNNLMDSITQKSKDEIKKFAKRALKCIENDNWEKIFDDSDGKCIDDKDIKSLESTFIASTPKPWSRFKN